jgi:hypothetical protein
MLCTDTPVGLATGYRLDGRGLIPGRGKIFLFSTVSRPARRSTQPPIQWVLAALSLGVKQPGCKTCHSPPSSAEAKNGTAIPPIPHMSSWYSAWLITQSDNFTFYLYWYITELIPTTSVILYQLSKPITVSALQFSEFLSSILSFNSVNEHCPNRSPLPDSAPLLWARMVHKEFGRWKTGCPKQ